MGRFNRRVTNRVTRRFAGWMPWFGIVIHVGRRSARVFETPVNVFRDGDRYVFALTYGPDADWVRNVVAAGGCELRTRRQTVRLRDPERFCDARRSAMPVPVRSVLALARVDEFMALTAARDSRSQTPMS